jgi:hypothetical protein
MRNPNEDRRGDGHERFYLTHFNDERIRALANQLYLFARLLFRAAQTTRWEDGDVCGQMGMRRMEFAAQVLDELAEGISDVSH